MVSKEYVIFVTWADEPGPLLDCLARAGIKH
jgi:hypothetical protein